MVEAGHHVSGSVSVYSDADKLRALGALPIYVDELRGSELAAVVRMAKADVVVDLGRQDLNQSLRAVRWDTGELDRPCQARRCRRQRTAERSLS
ncbi:MAG: hypothetical protein HND48_26510 [Chloroflexi bacterium]|nr:hypothetical protein [Chloroflexota bacterium]